MKIISQSSAALLLSLALLSGPGSAKSLAHIESAINQVQPQGTGRLNFWGFHVYDATLYRPAGKDSADFALDIKYQKSFSGAAIASRTADEMRNIGVSEAQSIIWGKELAAILPNVEPGQTLTGVYSPKQGTTLFYDGKKIAQIPGQIFLKPSLGFGLIPKQAYQS